MAGWTGKRFYLGTNKEDFDAELHALYHQVLQARSTQSPRIRLRLSSARNPTILAQVSGSPLPPFLRQNTLTPSHPEAEGNETLDMWAKSAIENRGTVSQKLSPRDELRPHDQNGYGGENRRNEEVDCRALKWKETMQTAQRFGDSPCRFGWPWIRTTFRGSIELCDRPYSRGNTMGTV